MKTYIFANGRIDTDNLSGAQIKEKEREFGRLEMVIDGNRKIPVDYNPLQIPVEEHSWYKKKQEQKPKERRRHMNKDDKGRFARVI